MRTPGLRARVAVVTLGVLALAFAGFAVSVTLSYRDGLLSELRAHIERGAAELRSAPAAQIKPLVANLALDGIAARIVRAPAPSKRGPAVRSLPQKAPLVQSEGSLIVAREPLTQTPQPLEATLTANAGNVSGNVTHLITVELIAAAAALVVATLLLLRGLSAALEPLGHVGRVAARIAAGDWRERLRPRHPHTELGRMAASFDAMVDALEAAVQQARASEGAMRRFLADASHELRTPIAALQATAETLLREQPRRPDRDALEAQLAREAARLGRLSDDLLNLARLEASEPPHRAPLDLAEVATTAAQEARERVAGTEIVVSRSGDTRALGDADALGRALRNLLDNALRATGHRGRIHIDVHRADGAAVARVTDSGPGIPPGERERIFDGFVRLDQHQPGGAGLGLAIARRIARQHAGELICEPCESGASFALIVPVAPN